uniref:Uncharacterized protein n=1 Tax=Romanomermis culicivorax TaxID=13658 RepID=A0A915K013_ROMCU
MDHRPFRKQDFRGRQHGVIREIKIHEKPNLKEEQLGISAFGGHPSYNVLCKKPTMATDLTSLTSRNSSAT